ncbi:MAG: hypothetical protein QXD82_02075 [Nitrososphaerales archaeon]
MKIPREIALELCNEIRRENSRKKFGIGKTQCSFCYELARDNPSRLCIFTNELNRGCSQVNKRYDDLYIKK